MMVLALALLAVLGPAVLGPALLRRGAAILVRAPHAASIALLGVVMTWLVASGGISLALAAVVSGPQLLPVPFAEVCQRCLAASSPFTPPSLLALPVPAAPLVLLPLGGAGVLAVMGVLRLRKRMRANRALGKQIQARGQRSLIGGREVILLPDRDAQAFTLPRGHGGIVLSQGLLDLLCAEELAAVIEHEDAHLRLRHHEIMAALHAFARPLRFIPLVGAVHTTITHLVEIAADDASRRRCTTSALASALLKLGTGASTSLAPGRARSSVLLHATGQAGTGPDRIRHLVAPRGIRAAMVPALLLSIWFVMLVGISAFTVWPHVELLLAGCVLPA